VRLGSRLGLDPKRLGSRGGSGVAKGAEGPCAEACDGPPSNKAVKKFIMFFAANCQFICW